jgi:hypothetical protein
MENLPKVAVSSRKPDEPEEHNLAFLFERVNEDPTSLSSRSGTKTVSLSVRDSTTSPDSPKIPSLATLTMPS